MFPATESFSMGVEEPIPILPFVVSRERRFPIFQALTPDARVVEADWLKLRELFPSMEEVSTKIIRDRAPEEELERYRVVSIFNCSGLVCPSFIF